MNTPSRTAAASIVGLALAMSTTAHLHAAELKVLAGGAMTGVMGELGPAFERASGHKLTIQFGATPDLIKLATSGAPFDVAVAPVDLFQNAAARAQFAPAATTDIASVGFGVAVRAGAPKPDIGTPDAFKQALLNAQSIALLPGSAAGAYVLKVFDRLGIAEAMKAKTKVQTAPAGIPQAVAKGEAELGVFLTNVLIAPGVELAGPFPAALQQALVFTAAVAATSTDAAAAQAFIDYLKTPAAAVAIKAKGMEP